MPGTQRDVSAVSLQPARVAQVSALPAGCAPRRPVVGTLRPPPCLIGLLTPLQPVHVYFHEAYQRQTCEHTAGLPGLNCVQLLLLNQRPCKGVRS